jgi:hypothetical protein
MADVETSRLLIREKREEWRRIRADRLRRKEELESGGLSIGQIRRDRTYKSLMKKQRLLSKEIRHIERPLNRKISKLNQAPGG